MKKKIQKTIILFLALIGLYNVTTCSVMLYPMTREEKIVRYSGQITESELKSFLPLWSEFYAKYGEDADFAEVSLTQKLPSEILPISMKLWLRFRGWETNRFFYFEQRLREILNNINMKRHAKDVIAVMNESLKNESDKATRENIKSVIATQQNILDHQTDTPETVLVEKYINDVINTIGR